MLRILLILLLTSGSALAQTATLSLNVYSANRCIVTPSNSYSGEPIANVEMPFGGVSCDVPVALPPGTNPTLQVDQPGVVAAAFSPDGVELNIPANGNTIIRILAVTTPGQDPVEVWQASVTKDAFP